jgi:hypothetical protein
VPDTQAIRVVGQCRAPTRIDGIHLAEVALRQRARDGGQGAAASGEVRVVGCLVASSGLSKICGNVTVLDTLIVDALASVDLLSSER